jgi:hypothetical protein
MRAIRDSADAAKFAALVIRRHLPDPAYRIFLFGSARAGRRPSARISTSASRDRLRCRMRRSRQSMTRSRKPRRSIRSMSSISGVCRRNSAKSRNSASGCDKISIVASRFRARRHASGRGCRPPPRIRSCGIPRFSGSRFCSIYAGSYSRPISTEQHTPCAPHPEPVFAWHSGTGSSTAIRFGSI